MERGKRREREREDRKKLRGEEEKRKSHHSMMKGRESMMGKTWRKELRYINRGMSRGKCRGKS